MSLPWVPIAIVGAGGVFPDAPGLDALWANVLAGRSAAGPVPPGRWILPPDEIVDSTPGAPDRVASNRACLIHGAPTAAGPVPPVLEGLDPLYLLGWEAARQAWQGVRAAGLDRRRVGLVMGNIVLPDTAAAEDAVALLDEAGTLRPASYRGAGLPAGLIARLLGFGLGGVALDAACASSLYAIKLACAELAAGRADAMVAGGLSRPDSLYTQMGFSQLRALSPTGRSAPFDAAGDGLVVGEGAGMVALKRLADAERDGDSIWGVIRGIGTSNDLEGSLLAPHSEGQLRAMREAYRLAGWVPGEVDLVECHATGTPRGDAVEVASLRALREGHTAPCVIGSVKSNLGHLLTAAGSAGLIKALLALRSRVLPPTANFRAAPEGWGLDEAGLRVLMAPEPWPEPDGRPRRAAVSAFGFGGINAHVLLEEHVPGRSTGLGEPLPRPERVAIVGLGARYGALADADAFREATLAGDDAARAPRVEAADRAGFRGRLLPQVQGAYMPADVPVPLGAFRVPPREWTDWLPQQALTLLACDEALRDVSDAWADRTRRHPRAGAYVGITLDPRTTDWHRRWRRLARQEGSTVPPLTAERTLGALGGMVASRLAREFRFGGPTHTVQAEEAAAMRALEVGVRALQRGEVDLALVAAVDLPGDGRVLVARSREGCPLPTGEGAGAVVLKRLSDAERDGDRIYAVIDGLASCGALAAAASTEAPDAATISQAIQGAWGEAGAAPQGAGLLELDGLDDEAEREAVARVWGQGPAVTALGRVAQAVGRSGAAGGMASLLRACLSLYHEILPAWSLQEGDEAPASSLHLPRVSQYWFRDRGAGPRRAGVNLLGRDGTACHVVLSAPEAQPSRARERASRERHRPLGRPRQGLFALAAPDRDGLAAQLDALQATAVAAPQAGGSELAERWWRSQGVGTGALGLALVARDGAEVLERIREARLALAGERQPGSDTANPGASVFHSSLPLGPGPLAFVYPGSGNHFVGMDAELWAAFPWVPRRQDSETTTLLSQVRPHRTLPWRGGWPEGWQAEADAALAVDTRTTLLTQVAHGALMTDLVSAFGVRPQAVLGLSLGETAGLVATRAWTDRDELTRRMVASKLFTVELGGRCAAAARAWGLSAGVPAAWRVGAVDRSAEAVRAALEGLPRAYLLIVTGPAECVVGGDPGAVDALVGRLGCSLVPLEGITTVHCEVATQVQASYRALHDLPTSPPAGVAFYSGRWGHRYAVDRDTAADSILAQALGTVDYPAVVRAAYADGVRHFVELGPRNSCSRLIRNVLGDVPHLARSACQRGPEPIGVVLRLLAHLHAERVPIDLAPLYGHEVLAPRARVASSHARVPLHAPLFAGGEPGSAVRLPLRRGRKVAAREGNEAPAVAAAAVSGSVLPSKAASPAEPAGAPGQALARALPSAVVPRRGAAVASVRPADGGPGREDQPPPVAVTPPAAQDLLATGLSAVELAWDRLQAEQARVAQEAEALVALLERLLGPANGAALMGASTAAPDQVSGSAPAPVALPVPSAAPAPAAEAASVTEAPVFLDRAGCLAYARGAIGPVLGPYFAPIDAFPTRVRLPDEPLMLVDRILAVTGERGSLTHGTIVTEHDVRDGAWYLDANKIPTCIAVEAGQADLFLSGWLGIDFKTRGLAMYRLLDAVVTFHGPLPGPGATIHYDIAIERFMEQGGVTLFFFRFDATVDGQPLLTMREGCAGFFSPQQLEDGRGIVFSTLEQRPVPGRLPPGWQPLLPTASGGLDDRQLEALRAGDLAGAFGEPFDRLPFARAATLPGGLMRLVDRVTCIEPEGGRHGIGLIRAEHDVVPDAWYLTCHFVDDQVMPGTLMYECCMHTLRIGLMRLGWVGPEGAVAYEPLPGAQSRLKCRGQVLASTRVVTYEITLKELGADAEGTPFAIADALMLADGKPIVLIADMTVRATGLRLPALAAMWEEAQRPRALPVPPGCLYGPEHILAFAVGRPSLAFGDRYRVFDAERVIARLPGPPYMFLDRITAVEGEPWACQAGAACEAAYDVPPDAWYFSDEGQPTMPFAVLLEVALQPCGWLAAYVGSALTSPIDLSFRNLGGQAVQHRVIGPDIGTLLTRACLTAVSHAAGMIIQEFTFDVTAGGAPVYTGTTTFGFFTKAALAQQVGLRGVSPWEVEAGPALAFPREFGPMPLGKLALLSDLDVWHKEGGRHGLGLMRGRKRVDPADWYFSAHFYQDPVCPGSLGLEGLVQLLKVEAWRRWGGEVPDHRFAAMVPGAAHSWMYRGQIIPTSGEVVVEAHLKAIDEVSRTLVADGLLLVDGRPIYGMTDFAVGLRPEGPT
ncbi:MAG: beta-ketoacyl synthase N-terminal-like domain-containing protein [Candidatus Sericytochromatia bacterium]|nr:beta-ketoacyl synthase N-terminal-like domain-containing protein [Candidatus Sericytochromatia bacterium]